MTRHIHHAIKFNKCIVVLTIGLALTSCDELLRNEPPASTLGDDEVFNNEVTATGAVTGIYSMMFDVHNFASGSNQSITMLAGLSADELTTYGEGNFPAQEFYKNTITKDNPYIAGLWNSAYKSIYQANAVIEGLSRSSLRTGLKDQLRGEALFIRAFCHFYLVNLFGPVPVITTPNAQARRQSTELVYNQIKTDLLAAQSLLQEPYVTQGRVRPNKSAATAMLARVYLYLQDWSNAEAAANTVIADSTMYKLTTGLNQVFLSTSPEAIWQLLPQNRPTNEAFFFVITSAPQSDRYLLNPAFLNSFEENDNRARVWIGRLDQWGSSFYFPYKYKVNQSMNSPEYSMILRLAEQYLIRAEARAHQNKLPDAAKDLNEIRNRAGLANTAAATQDALLLAIAAERRHELFTEWGHRWLDLKRTGQALATLSFKKDNLSANDLLYPIPAEEFKLNPALGNQNDGY